MFVRIVGLGAHLVVAMVVAGSSRAQDTGGRLFVGVTVVAPCQVTFETSAPELDSSEFRPEVKCPQWRAFEAKVDIATVAVPPIPEPVEPVSPNSSPSEHSTQDTDAQVDAERRVFEIAF